MSATIIITLTIDPIPGKWTKKLARHLTDEILGKIYSEEYTVEANTKVEIT